MRRIDRLAHVDWVCLGLPGGQCPQASSNEFFKFTHGVVARQRPAGLRGPAEIGDVFGGVWLLKECLPRLRGGPKLTVRTSARLNSLFIFKLVTSGDQLRELSRGPLDTN